MTSTLMAQWKALVASKVNFIKHHRLNPLFNYEERWTHVVYLISTLRLAYINLVLARPYNQDCPTYKNFRSCVERLIYELLRVIPKVYSQSHSSTNIINEAINMVYNLGLVVSNKSHHMRMLEPIENNSGLAPLVKAYNEKPDHWLGLMIKEIRVLIQEVRRCQSSTQCIFKDQDLEDLSYGFGRIQEIQEVVYGTELVLNFDFHEIIPGDSCLVNAELCYVEGVNNYYEDSQLRLQVFNLRNLIRNEIQFLVYLNIEQQRHDKWFVMHPLGSIQESFHNFLLNGQTWILNQRLPMQTETGIARAWNHPFMLQVYQGHDPQKVALYIFPDGKGMWGGPARDIGMVSFSRNSIRNSF